MKMQIKKDLIEPAGLYIHVPFCLRKCPYCDFFSTTDLSLRHNFVRALLQEMKMTRNHGLHFDTLYIGGGTPSILSVRAVDQILETAHMAFGILDGAEITLEANPGTVDLRRLKRYRLSGINRINIGVQSFQEENLRFLGRIHSQQDARRAIRESGKSGIENIGLDVIYGIPGQSKKSWIDDLKQAVAFEPNHLSCYMLTFEPGTPLEKDRQMGRVSPADESHTAELFETTVAFLENAGYAQYEISNFARSFSNRSKINRSRHNQKYWSLIPYIGLGPSAHSFLEPVRWWNHRSVRKYIDELSEGRLPIDEKEQLKDSQRIIEAIYLGLRKTEGIDVNHFDTKFGVRFHDLFGKTVSDLTERGLMEADQYRCALSGKGMLLLDSIAAAFVCQDGF